jgi:diacylglycerol O-acyltransferase
MPIERLSAADLSMVWPEDFGWPQDIGAIAVLDGSSLLDATGRCRIEEVRDQIGSRLHLLPRFRQRLYMPRRGLGWPLWVDVDSVDLVRHVGVFPLEAGAGEAELLAACERLRRRPLDRSRPLWELWFLPGLPEGRVGLFMKLHHAVADGMAGAAAFGAFLDFIPDGPPLSAPTWKPAPIPSERELFRDNVSRRAHAARAFVSRLAHPGDTAREIRRDWPAVREAFGEGPAPLTSVNRRVGSDRRLALIQSRLDLVKGIAHAQGGKVNDVLMAAVAGGYRELLQSRGERVQGLMLRAMVPVSLHREQPGQARGNLDGAMVVPLPIGERDDVRRLRWIAAETAREDEGATAGGHAVPQRRHPAGVRPARRPPAVHERVRGQRSGPTRAAVPGRSGVARGVPGGSNHGKHDSGHRGPLLRRAVQRHRGCGPGRLPRRPGLRRRGAGVAGRAGSVGSRRLLGNRPTPYLALPKCPQAPGPSPLQVHRPRMEAWLQV